MTGEKDGASVSLPASAVLKIVANLMRFPRPLVCRHYVAGNLLSALEEAGYPLSNDLAKAVVNGWDEEALEILELEGAAR